MKENIIAEIGTGLAQKTKPRSVPENYLDKTVMDVINYLEKTIQKDGNDEDRMIITDVHDQMKKNFIIEVNGTNVKPGSNFSDVLKKATTVEDAGEGEEELKFRTVSITVSSVQKGGDATKIKKDYTPLTIDQLGKVTKTKPIIDLGKKVLYMLEQDGRHYSIMLYRDKTEVKHLKKLHKLKNVGVLYDIDHGQAFMSKGGNVITIYEHEKKKSLWWTFLKLKIIELSGGFLIWLLIYKQIDKIISEQVRDSTLYIVIGSLALILFLALNYGKALEEISK